MARRNRLDTELVRRGLARSREHAVELIAAGRVQLRGARAEKPAAMVDPAEPVRVIEAESDGYVSRGGHKLAGALATFGGADQAGNVGGADQAGNVGGADQAGNVGGAGQAGNVGGAGQAGNVGGAGQAGNVGGADQAGNVGPAGLAVAGRRCLDAGASTGGFTDVLLRHGAAAVIAVDVGYGQIAWRLRNDSRVTVLERTNVRGLTPDAIGGPVDLTVADLSFISLRLVLPALAACTAPDGDLVPMVKPQFEVGRERVGAGGVVRDPALRAEAVLGVAAAAQSLGLGVAGVAVSPLPGPSGNVEFFLWLRRGAPPVDPAAVHAVTEEATA
jgi:23S rRNA (cytidine1920-2'-O)/16S rRNA (cytidine1409-2'-O)-methyltransferase